MFYFTDSVVNVKTYKFSFDLQSNDRIALVTFVFATMT